MIQNILVVCTANICRSAVAEAALARNVAGIKVHSAGLNALVGRGADPVFASAAEEVGIFIDSHSARQFDDALGLEADIIIAMETHHRHDIGKRWPHFVGKSFLLGHFDNGRQVPDPFKAPLSLQLQSATMIRDFCKDWAVHLNSMVK